MSLFERVNHFLGKNVKYWSLMKTIEELVEVGEQQQKQIAELKQQLFFAQSDTVSLKKAPYDDIDD
jgi:hypothetical protein